MAYSIEGTQVPDLVGNNTWSGTNKFDGRSGNSSLSIIDLDDEGYPITTYSSYTAGSSAVTKNNALYTSWTERTTGPAVIIEGPINSVNAGLVSGEGDPAGLGVAKNIYGDTVYNAVWNDMVDCIEVPEDTELEPGYAYSFDGKEYHKTTKYLDKGYIGIHSDTYGFGVGALENTKQLNVAIAGFVLAYVDKDYKPGTPLTCTEGGYLTELSVEDMEKNPYLLVGTFWKPERNNLWGGAVRYALVNGRKWVRVR